MIEGPIGRRSPVAEESSVRSIEEVEVVGGPGADLLSGGSFPGVLILVGLGGNDLLNSGPRDDVVDGGRGNDWLDANAGNDDMAGVRATTSFGATRATTSCTGARATTCASADRAATERSPASRNRLGELDANRHVLDAVHEVRAHPHDGAGELDRPQTGEQLLQQDLGLELGQVRAETEVRSAGAERDVLAGVPTRDVEPVGVRRTSPRRGSR